MQTRSLTCDRIIMLVANFFMINKEGLTPDSSAVDVPGWDSVTQVGFLMQLEDEFGVQIDIVEANCAPDLAALADIIERARVPGSERR